MVGSKLALTALILAAIGAGCSNSAAPSAASQTPADTTSPRPLLDYELSDLRMLPQKADLALRSVKPGHWTQAVQQAKANNSDFVGTFQAEVRDDALGPPAQLDHVRYCMTFQRPAALSMKQPKWFETSLIVPSSRTRAWLVSELKNRSGFDVEIAEAQALTLLKGHQYFLVVLSADADRYHRLERLDSVIGPDAEAPLDYYQVVAKTVDEGVPLPTSALYWTSIAYLVWDDVDPQLLTSEQKQALIDWLHWGGQLIVSGPKSLDQLRDQAFLGDYLPALPGKAIAITRETLAPLNARWTLPVKGAPGQPLAPATPWSGVSLEPQADARFLPDTANLVVERTVGRGRIVATAFRLAEHDLWAWPSFDGFLNACLLRRSARVFSAAPEVEGGGLVVKWADGQQSLDPALVTQLRYFSRDEPPLPPAPTGRGRRWRGGDDSGLTAQLSQERLAAAGVASWNDFGGVADAARQTLRRAAGIVIPNSRFVIRLLLAYLVILVPLNWLIFWAIGRVEWAWIAAPLIALGGMFGVVRLAQLDIGFARSQTEIAVLETYGGHPRGHLTRYTALYTSLATNYTLRSDDPATVILPFASDAGARRLAGLEPDTVSLHTTPKVELTDMAVASNSTAIVHTEQMIDLGGPFELVSRDGDSRLANRTKYGLRQAAVLRRAANGEFQIAWIGELPAGGEADLDFVTAEATAPVIPNWTFATAETGVPSSTSLNLDQLANIVRAPSRLRTGETRLLAMVDTALPGMAIEPDPSQAPRAATVVIAHLVQPQPDPPHPDSNSRYAIVAPGEESDTAEPTMNQPVSPDQPVSPAADPAPAS